MAEYSLGRAVAVVALQPIAERLAEQCEREEAEAGRVHAEREMAERVRAEREVRISSGLATLADLDEIAREASSEIATQDPSVARQIWARLVASGAVGTPTHDLLAVHGSGGSRSRPPRFAELSRAPAWCAPSVGRHEPEETHDVWLDAEGTIWSPCNPRWEGGGGLNYGLDKDNQGRLINPNLTIAVPHGSDLNMRRRGRRRGMYYERRTDLIDGTVVDTGREWDIFNNQGAGKHADLHSAVAAILRARESVSPLEEVGD